MAMTHPTTSKNNFGTYRFKDKDPVIDIMRSLIQLEANVRAVSFDAACRKVADDAGVSYGCLIGWFHGRTVSPKFSNLQRVAHACGVEFSPHAIGNPKKRFN